MKMLARESLSPEKQAALASLQYHPGYLVLKELADDGVRQASQDLVALNPDDPNYDVKLKSVQLMARAVTEAYGSLWRSVEVHAQASAEQD